MTEHEKQEFWAALGAASQTDGSLVNWTGQLTY